MRSLYLRIWLTVVASLALFALVSGWLLQRHLEEQRERAEVVLRDRLQAWGDLVQATLPPIGAPAAEQAESLDHWSRQMRMPMALDGADGQRIARSDSWERRELDQLPRERLRSIRLDDGRTLWLPRLSGRGFGPPGGLGPPGVGGLPPAPDSGTAGAPAGPGARGLPAEMRRPATALDSGWPASLTRPWPEGLGLIVLLAVLFAAVAAGAWPVVRRLTRRLEALKAGVEAFGGGALHQRVAEDGRDEVAAVAASFNRAAARVETLVRSHQSLLANASHELRSPLARLKMALAMIEDAAPAERTRLKREIDTNIAELDALVEEVLLSSRLDAAAVELDAELPVSLLGLAAEEAARVGAVAGGDDIELAVDERLVRRALRNLLENARRYAGEGIEVQVQRTAAAGGAELRVCDRGPGVPEAQRERIFEPFFRLPGHAERAGGVGLGLALVRQIAERHGGRAFCEPREGGGSCFVISLPPRSVAAAPPASPR